MKIAVAGASGFIGGALVPFLTTRGHVVHRLVRRPAAGAAEIAWNPSSGEVEWEKLDGVETIINLAGANLSQGRWTRERKEEILRSRVESTRTLVAIMTRMNHRPRVFVSASAVGYYGNRGEEEVTESSAAGEGFLAGVCRAWEDEARGAEVVGIRTVLLRTGLVLGRGGGALAKMLPLFQAGLGGRLGNGRQWMSWIALGDLVRVALLVLDVAHLNGPLNAVAPHPIRNSEFTRALARAVGRWTFAPMPAPALRALFGEMADEVLLASVQATPRKLLAEHFNYSHPLIEGALRAAVGTP